MKIRNLDNTIFVTEWMKDTQESFDLLRAETKEIAQKYLDFVNSFHSAKGVGVIYDAIDGDSIDEKTDIVKWMVTLSISDSEGLTEKLKDVEQDEIYQVIQLKDKQVLHCGSFSECYDHVGKLYPSADLKDEEDDKYVAQFISIEFKESVDRVKLI